VFELLLANIALSVVIYNGIALAYSASPVNCQIARPKYPNISKQTGESGVD
jgi:hypothetical protein